jgi:hypothetical protein
MISLTAGLASVVAVAKLIKIETRFCLIGMYPKKQQ